MSYSKCVLTDSLNKDSINFLLDLTALFQCPWHIMYRMVRISQRKRGDVRGSSHGVVRLRWKKTWRCERKHSRYVPAATDENHNIRSEVQYSPPTWEKEPGELTDKQYNGPFNSAMITTTEIPWWWCGVWCRYMLGNRQPMKNALSACNVGSTN